jgi:hypothetical protein
MSIEAARAFMQTVQRGIVAHHEAPTFWFDCDTVLTTVARFGASAGFAFTGEEYRKVVTEHI